MPAYMVGMSNIHAARKYGKRWRKTTALNQSDDAAPASGAKYSVQPEALECGDEGLPAAAVPRRQPEPLASRARVLPQNFSPRILSSRVLAFDSPSDAEATVVATDLEANMALRRGSAALKVP